jgi:hypothetical protein
LRAAAALALVVAAPPAGAEALAFEFAVVNGAVPPNVRVVRVKEGDAVTLRFRSDKALVLHLHGYEIETRVAAGGTATMTFTARLTGRFPVHVHGVGAAQANAESVLVEVEVYPR